MQFGSSWKQMPLSIFQTVEKTRETNKENGESSIQHRGLYS
jgi:hypothetical protein